MNTRSFVRVLTLGLALSACGPDQTSGGGGDGDAIGSAASGEYDIDSVTTACSGRCVLEGEGGFTVSVCDIGARLSASATVTQSDGHLRIDSDDSDYFSRMEGGIDANGSFDVSGLKTLEGGNFSVTMHVTGSFGATDSAVTGTARGHVVSSSPQGSFDCNIVADVTGTRL